MRFQPTEHADVKAAIRDAGLPYDAFSFVKSKGYLHIRHSAAPQDFVFYRKKEARMNASKQLEQYEQYYRVSGRKKTPVESWSIVLQNFKDWLNQLA